MIIYPICSSSKGNCLFIKSEQTAILIDVGISYRQLVKYLHLAGFDEKQIKAIFITHEHSDHVNGLYTITKLLKIPIYSSKETLKSLILKGLIFEGSKLFEINKKPAKIDEIKITAFRVLHDGSFGVRFCVCDGNKKFVICTDIGAISLEAINNFKGADLVFLEANYDVNMLNSGSYPIKLKRRISSNYGHLSNNDAAKIINFLIDNGVKKFLIGHLSQKNNLPQLALKTIISFLLKKEKKFMKDYSIEVAAHKTTGKIYSI